ncbi:MAG: LLM class flavin-dependent oxidoreductase [Cyanobacteria bacterium]|jgi:natural product biosynthesis luciferase-like monooxygenase protein|nr:LLM class flavin-dependent oxidoreductase [Cyanobacteria bacterium GSL.Bin1]
MEFSLLFFSGDGSSTESDKYRLLLESSKFADQNGFSAIWTPERHFHPFGGLYPNPSVMNAALAMETQNIALRAGSVVLPLQHPLRVAEEWAVVDSLSQGRVGIAFASGWHVDDFVLAPGNYEQRKQEMWQGIETVQKLWQGETVSLPRDANQSVSVQTFPKPVQSQLPIWITAQSEQTFAQAGAIGANILTALLHETIEDVAQKIARYRESLASHGYDPNSGQVTLMLHTFLGEDLATVKETVREPFCNYLKTNLGLLKNLLKTFDMDQLTEDDIDSILTFGYERYLDGRTLIGTPTSCLSTLDQVKEAGVNEVACLIDFGVAFDQVMSSLSYLRQLKDNFQTQPSHQAVVSS